MIFPRYSVSVLSPTSFRVTPRNKPAGITFNVYLSEGEKGTVQAIATNVATATYDITGLDATKNYAILISYNDFPFEKNVDIITEDSTSFTFEAIPPTTVTELTETVVIPWGANITGQWVLIDNVQTKGINSNKRVSISKSRRV